MTINDTIVKIVDFTVVDNLKCSFYVEWQHQMACKSIARAAWDNAKCCLALGKGACNLVYGSVAAHSYHDIYSSLSCFFGEN